MSAMTPASSRSVATHSSRTLRRAGEQQLADRLAALDLLAAEAPLALVLARRRLARRRRVADWPRGRRAPLPGCATSPGRPGRGVALAPPATACRRTRRARPPPPPPPRRAGCRPSLTSWPPGPPPSRRCPRRGRARRGPRPGGPSRVTGAPTTSARRSCISSRRGASFGRSHTTEQSTLTDRPARRLAPCARPRASRSIESAPCQRVVGVGEVLADVAEAGGAEQRVGDGVGDDVGVAVAGEARARRGTRTPPSTMRRGRVVA